MPGSEKSDGAFRTIREVADWLVVPTHVLRFWESKFEQIAPVKGAGGRRYYRPDDMKLLGGIKVMLHDQGLTVRGVSQKIDDEGVEAVMALSPDLEAIDTPPQQRARRVIRAGDEVEGEKVVAFMPKPDVTPPSPPKDVTDEENDPETAQPDAPDEDAETAQPVDVEAPPQPTDTRPFAPKTQPQPDPDIDILAAPGSDPTPPASDERGPELTATPPQTGDAPASNTQPAEAKLPTTPPALSALEKRQLRRVVRKLRALIEEVQEEMSEGDHR